MSLRRITANLSITALSCLAICSLPLFARAEFRTDIAAAKRVQQLNPAVSRSRTEYPASSSRDRKIAFLIKPSTIYYLSYGTQRGRTKQSNQNNALPTETPTQLASIKPFTIYYSVSISNPPDIIKTPRATMPNRLSITQRSPTATVPPKVAAFRDEPSEIKSAVPVDQENRVTATAQVTPATSEGGVARSEPPPPGIRLAPDSAKPVEDNDAATSGTSDKRSAVASRSQVDAKIRAPLSAAGQTAAAAQSMTNVVQNTPNVSQPLENTDKPITNTRSLPAAAANDSVALNNYAIRLTSEARYEEAARLLKRAIGLAPDTFGLHRNLSIVYESMGKMGEAVTAARNAVKLAPSDPSALAQLCGLEVITGQNAGAVTCFEKLLEFGPLDTFSQTFYGVALLRSERSSEAIEALEKALLVGPANAAALNALGVANFNNKKFESAVSFFKRAVEFNPENGELRFNLAIAHLALQNKEGAMSQYRLLKVEHPPIAKRLYRVLFRDKVVFLDRLETP